MYAEGLEGVVAVTTAIGRVDGEKGELVVRGQKMDAFAPAATYVDTASLLFGQRHATALHELGLRRVEAFERCRPLWDAARVLGAMDFLRFSVSALPSSGVDLGRQAASAAAMLAVAGPLWSRAQAGLAPIEPDPSLSQPADFLRMLDGSSPSTARARALQTYLVTVTDHGMNASTFTARVIASTQSDLISAIVGALGALKGPLHGGAPGPVLDMLDAIGRPQDAESWIRAELEAGRRIMGMGHRVYRVRDPRAAIFEQALQVLSRAQSSARLELARAVESAAERVLAERKPDRALRANVEFYTAVLLEAVGVPRDLFTPTFALGRVLGWSAHVIEQRENGRLIRPRSAYSGPEPS